MKLSLLLLSGGLSYRTPYNMTGASLRQGVGCCCGGIEVVEIGLGITAKFGQHLDPYCLGIRSLIKRGI